MSVCVFVCVCVCVCVVIMVYIAHACSRVFDKIFGLDRIGSVQTIVGPIYY